MIPPKAMIKESELLWALVAQEEGQRDMRDSEVGRKYQREVGSSDSKNVPLFPAPLHM